MSEHDTRPADGSPAQLPGASLGEVLRRGREARGLSREELARSLRLEPRIVAILENDALDELPAPAFTRGYVRALSKELGIDGAPLLAYLDERYAGVAPVLADFASRAPLQVTSDSQIVRYTTLAVALVMVVMVGLWLRSHEPAAPLVERDAAPGAPVALADTPPLPYTFAQVVHPDEPSYRAPDPVEIVTPADTVSATTAADTALPSTAGATAGAADIVIAAREDSWIQVQDVNGERLYYNIVRAGNQIEIAGRRPYSLVIGNAGGVSLLFDGQAVDLDAIAEEGVARLELGQDRLTQ